MTGLTREQILESIQSRDLQSEAVKDCAESVKADNPDLSKSQAFAICQSQENEGQLSDVDLTAELQEEDPCESGWVMVGTKQQNGQTVPNCVPEEDADPANLADDCPEGQVEINGECVEVEEVDTPPGLLNSAPRVLAQRELAGPIKRQELDDGGVRYTNIKLLSHGVWTDANSKEPTEYVPKNLEIEAGATVNIAHDDDNEVAEVGEIDAESATVEDGDMFADIVLHRENAASEFADENLQQTLETNGQKGFGGPSVEIPAEGLVVEEGGELGYPVVEEGKIAGLGLVKEPASKPTAFDTQTRNRAVALNGQTDKALLLQKRYMAEIEEIRSTLEQFGFETDDMDDDDVMDMAESLHDDLMENLDMAEHDDEYEEEEEDDDTDMAGNMNELMDRVETLEAELDALRGEMMDEQAMSEELEDAKEELAAAETVQELEEAEEELDKRLSELENQEKETKTLADGQNTETEGEDTEYSVIGPAQSRGY